MKLVQKLLNIQNELKCAKTQFNEYGQYYYRNCEDILEAVKPLCKKYQTVLRLYDEIVLIGDRYYVKAYAVLSDTEDGNECDDIMNVSYAREEENLKGMTGAQLTGSTSSYARKYALNGLFNIDDTKDADFTNTGDKDKKPPQNDKKGTTQPATPAPMTLHIAENITALKGDKKVKFKELTTEELEKLAAQDKRKDWQEAANLILDFKVKQEQEKFKNGDLPF